MANGDNPPRFYDLGPFRLDAVKFLLLRGGNLVAVSPKATQILALLVRRRGELVEKQDILDAVWKNVAVEEGVIAHYVSELRRVLRDASNGDRWIETVPSRGYRFVGPARPVPDPAGRLEDAVGKRAEIIESPHSEFEGLAYKFRRVAVLLPYHLGFVGLIVGLLLLGLRIKYPPEPRVLNVRPITHDGFDKKWIAPVIVGDQAYFTEIAQSYRVMRVPLRGGESEPVPALDGFSLWETSADGSEILAGKGATSHNELWILPAAGGAGRFLGLDGDEPTWSPDGTRIVYRDATRLWVVGKDGKGPKPLPTPGGLILCPQWSPDGKLVRFATGDNNQYDPMTHWEVRPDGTGLRTAPPELSAGRNGGYGRWTPEGRWYLFERVAEDIDELWARREKCGWLFWECGKVYRLTQGPVSYSRPLPLKDGRELLALGKSERGDVCRFDGKSNSFIRAPELQGTPATEMDFSRDGKWIVYRNRSDHSIWRCRSDGSEKRQLTIPPIDAVEPRWSPDGKLIAFNDQSKYAICIVPSNGGEPRVVTPGTEQCGVATWSPDSTRVVYGEPNIGRPPSEMSIHLLDLKTGEVSDLPGSTGLWTSRWSPDGRFIAALVLGDNATHTNSAELKLFEFATQSWTTLAKMERFNSISWSRDSKFVYFDTTGGTDQKLCRVRIANGRVEPLASLKDITRHVDNWSGVTPDGSPLIVKDTLISEIYALTVDWP